MQLLAALLRRAGHRCRLVGVLRPAPIQRQSAPEPADGPSAARSGDRATSLACPTSEPLPFEAADVLQPVAWVEVYSSSLGRWIGTPVCDFRSTASTEDILYIACYLPGCSRQPSTAFALWWMSPMLLMRRWDVHPPINSTGARSSMLSASMVPRRQRAR